MFMEHSICFAGNLLCASKIVVSLNHESGDAHVVGLFLQHALFLMRTPRIQKMTLHLEKKENEELIATIYSESGNTTTVSLPDCKICRMTIKGFKAQRMIFVPSLSSRLWVPPRKYVYIMNSLSGRHKTILWCQKDLLAGLQKTFGLPCLEAEILQATVDRDTLPTTVIAAAKELNRCWSLIWASRRFLFSPSHKELNVLLLFWMRFQSLNQIQISKRASRATPCEAWSMPPEAKRQEKSVVPVQARLYQCLPLYKLWLYVDQQYEISWSKTPRFGYNRVSAGCCRAFRASWRR